MESTHVHVDIIIKVNVHVHAYICIILMYMFKEIDIRTVHKIHKCVYSTPKTFDYTFTLHEIYHTICTMYMYCTCVRV